MQKVLHEGHRARMREAANSDRELSSFSDYQVLEYLLSFLIPRKDTNPLAHRLIDEFGSLYGVLHATPEELYDFPDMTNNAACFLPSMYSIIRKSEMTKYSKRMQLLTAADAANLLKPYFLGRNVEQLYCVSLDLNDRVIQVSLVNDGLVDQTTVDINKIVSIATRNKAKKMILAHNHPAGNILPSPADIAATKSLFVVLRAINTILNDHFIFCDEEYYSFFENNLLDECYKAYFLPGNDEIAKEMRTFKAEGRYFLENQLEDVVGEKK